MPGPDLCSCVRAHLWVTILKMCVHLAGRDLIGLAQTGSGKTGAFALPIIQDLLNHPQPLFACILSPTRLACLSEDVLVFLNEGFTSVSFCFLGLTESWQFKFQNNLKLWDQA